MAIALEPNSTYNLLSKDSSSPNRLFVHVKLTDTCLRALEEFQSHQGITKGKPSVRFSGQNGQIVIPDSSSKTEDGFAHFQFSCSAQQGSVDCIQQNKDSLDVLGIGMVTHKVNVLATDDSYHTTQQRMKEVEESRKGVRTKVIKTPSQAGKGNKGSLFFKHQNKILNNVKRKTAAPMAKIPSGAHKSVREHVIHLLALRPYNKLQLSSRLRKDGVSLKDKSSLTNVLQQVAAMSDNQYKLMKHVLPEIQVDTWPCYTDEERVQLRRSIESRGVNSKPLFNTTSLTKDFLRNKRPVPPGEAAQTSKKQRISRMNNNHETLELKPDKVTTANSIKHKYPKESAPEKQGGTDEDFLIATEEKEHYQERYKTITSNEQRSAYKKDFQVDFEKYTKLESSIKAVTRKFLKLEEKLKKSEGDEQKQNIEQAILELYQKQMDSQWAEKKKRFQELHAKLSHIKELIAEFDKK